MAVIEGRLQTLEVDAGSGFNAVGQVVSGTFNLDTEVIDVTTHDQAQFRQFIAGRSTGTIEATIRWDEANSRILEILTSTIGGLDTYGWRFRMQTGSGFKQYTCVDGTVSSMSATGPNDDSGELSITIQLNTTITDTNQ